MKLTSTASCSETTQKYQKPLLIARSQQFRSRWSGYHHYINPLNKLRFCSLKSCLWHVEACNTENVWQQTCPKIQLSAIFWSRLKIYIEGNFICLAAKFICSSITLYPLKSFEILSFSDVSMEYKDTSGMRWVITGVSQLET